MKTRYVILLMATAFLLVSPLSLAGQETKKERNLIKSGNEYFEKEKYSDAENCYKQVLEKNPDSQIAKFNLATTLLKQRSGENNSQDSVLTQQAAKLFGDVATAQSASKQLKQKSFYDLGRLAYDTEDYQSSVDFFKESLRINPADDQARKNLRMAQKKLQENQSNQQQQQDKDQNKDQDKQQDQQQQNQPQANPPKQDKPQLQNTTPDNILNAVQNEEKNTRDKVNKRKAQQMQGRPRSQKPW